MKKSSPTQSTSKVTLSLLVFASLTVVTLPKLGQADDIPPAPSVGVAKVGPHGTSTIPNGNKAGGSLVPEQDGLDKLIQDWGIPVPQRIAFKNLLKAQATELTIAAPKTELVGLLTSRDGYEEALKLLDHPSVFTSVICEISVLNF